MGRVLYWMGLTLVVGWHAAIPFWMAQLAWDAPGIGWWLLGWALLAGVVAVSLRRDARADLAELWEDYDDLVYEAKSLRLGCELQDASLADLRQRRELQDASVADLRQRLELCVAANTQHAQKDAQIIADLRQRLALLADTCSQAQERVRIVLAERDEWHTRAREAEKTLLANTILKEQVLRAEKEQQSQLKNEWMRLDRHNEGQFKPRLSPGGPGGLIVPLDSGYQEPPWQQGLPFHETF